MWSGSKSVLFAIFLLNLIENLKGVAEIEVKKCCGLGEAFNTWYGTCVTNDFHFEFKFSPTFLIKTNSTWTQSKKIVKLKKIHFDKCVGEVHRNSFQINQYGRLFQYDLDQSKTYFKNYRIFNDFCIDIDSETGENIFVVCNNTKTVKKCCDLNEKLKKIDDNSYECEASHRKEFLNDVSKFFKEKIGAELPNIEFKIKKEVLDGNYEILSEDSDSFFLQDNGAITAFQANFEEYCMEKYKDKWKVFLSVYSDEEISLQCIYIPYMEIISVIFLLFLAYYFKKERPKYKRLHRKLLTIYILFIAVELLVSGINSCLQNKYLFLIKYSSVLTSFCTLTSIWCLISIRKRRQKISGKCFVILFTIVSATYVGLFIVILIYRSELFLRHEKTVKSRTLLFIFVMLTYILDLNFSLSMGFDIAGGKRKKWSGFQKR